MTMHVIMGIAAMLLCLRIGFIFGAASVSKLLERGDE